MMLCKIMSKNYKDLNTLINSKTVLDFSGPSLFRMESISKACEKKSLRKLKKILMKFEKVEDPLLKSKIIQLLNGLEEENLKKILKPYSKVQILHIVNLIDLSL